MIRYTKQMFERKIKMANKQIKYIEPESYFSKEMRKAAGIGEYAKKDSNNTVSKSKKHKETNEKVR